MFYLDSNPCLAFQVLREGLDAVTSLADLDISTGGRWRVVGGGRRLAVELISS